MKKYMILFFIVLFNSCRSNDDAFVLITTLYNEADHQRCQEYIQCLEKNLLHPDIGKIHVFYDTSKDKIADTKLLNFLKSQDIIITYISGRATYKVCFDVANSHYPNQKIIVANGDIYFNETLSQLNSYDLNNKFLALTRWEINPDGSLRNQYGTNGKPLYCSQDAWIFRSPIRSFKNAEIKLGILGCDGTIAKQALLAGYEVLNPCLTIQCVHLHFTNIRHYPHQGYPASGYYEVKWDYLR